MKITDTPLFLKQPPYFTNPSLFMRKIWPIFLQKFRKLNLPPFLEMGVQLWYTSENVENLNKKL